MRGGGDLRRPRLVAGLRQRLGGRQLEEPLPPALGALEMRDPHRPVHRRPAYRARPRRDDLPRPAAQPPFGMHPEQVTVDPLNPVEHPGLTLPRPDPPQHLRRAIDLPVERPDRLPISGRARPPPPARPDSHPSGADPAAIASTASNNPCTAAWRTSWRYTLLFPTSRTRKLRVAHTSPASNSPLAASTVTPHSRIPNSIAQSNDDGPRSPTGPGCTTKHWQADQIDSGINRCKNGHTINSGRCSATAASIPAAPSTTATLTSWPTSVNATQAC